MNWLLLVISLATENATARMRIWRNLKTLGCASLRDGVWLLPAQPATRDSLNKVAEDVHKANGEAWVLEVQPDVLQAATFPSLFDRSADYTAFLDALAQCDLLSEDIMVTRKLLKNFAKRFAAITESDYFPHALQTVARDRLSVAESIVQRRLSVTEPTFQTGDVQRLNRADFQNRIWATRRDLWIDRLASAWLIYRFIDTNAQFLWLSDPTHCPATVLGFDFDGAQFTHLGKYVTFETLLVSFGLEPDVGLLRLGKLVHTLDVGGNSPEAAGIAALLTGLKRRTLDDDALLAEGSKFLDDLYSAFSA